MHRYPWRPINLREELKHEIGSTTYLSHGLHNYYPAKFIPQVPRFVINQLGLSAGVVLDPFAGSGTTAVECAVTGNSNISNDLSPLTRFLVDLKTLRLDPRLVDAHTARLNALLARVCAGSDEYLPDWKNVAYWYAPEILPVISRIWGAINAIDGDHPELAMILKASALHVSRRFSYDEDDSPKLFKSKFKRRKMEQILADFRERGAGIIFDKLRGRANAYLGSIVEFNRAVSSPCVVAEEWRAFEQRFILRVTRSVEDLPTAIPDGVVDCVVTSPPYMYAQEYFRSTKLDMYWLGLIDDAGVRSLTRSEIGQRTAAALDVHAELEAAAAYSETLAEVKKRAVNFKTPTNVSRFEAYFGDMLTFIKVSRRLLRPGGHLALFVGEPKVFGHHVPSKDIFAELLQMQGFTLQQVLFDTIKSRQLALKRLNENPDGMPGEWLIIGRKAE